MQHRWILSCWLQCSCHLMSAGSTSSTKNKWSYCTHRYKKYVLLYHKPTITKHLPFHQLVSIQQANSSYFNKLLHSYCECTYSMYSVRMYMHDLYWNVDHSKVSDLVWQFLISMHVSLVISPVLSVTDAVLCAGKVWALSSFPLSDRS